MKLYPDATREYLRDNASSLRSPRTIATYRIYLDLLQRAFPHKSVARFCEADLVAFCNGNDLAPGTVRQRRKIVMQFFDWATWRGLVRTNPALGLKRIVRPPTKGVRRRIWLSAPQALALIEACDDGTLLGERDAVLLSLGFLTGLRVHEISNLRWRDADLDLRTIRVLGKGEKEAVLGMSNQLALSLKRWKEAATLDLGHEPRDEHVIPALHSHWESKRNRSVMINWQQGLKRQAIARSIQRRAALAGVEPCAPHDMRRTYAGLLQQRGHPIEDISKALRHSNIATTQRYLEDNPFRAVSMMQEFEL